MFEPAVGHIYWFDNCPPLDGVERKRRPIVIVVCEDESSAPLNPLFAVGITTHPTDHYDRLQLPSLRDDPLTSTGLPEPCFALPRWLLVVYRDELLPANFIGELRGVLLYRLLEAVEARLDQPDWDAG